MWMLTRKEVLPACNSKMRDKFHKGRNLDQYRAGMACFPECCLKSDALSEIVAVRCIGSLMPSAGAEIAF
jgi:hypothetical protein